MVCVVDGILVLGSVVAGTPRSTDKGAATPFGIGTVTMAEVRNLRKAHMQSRSAGIESGPGIELEEAAGTRLKGRLVIFGRRMQAYAAETAAKKDDDDDETEKKDEASSMRAHISRCHHTCCWRSGQAMASMMTLTDLA